jgi:hypothetical protein
MGKNQDPGFGINIPDPQHWFNFFFFRFSVSRPFSRDSDITVRIQNYLLRSLSGTGTVNTLSRIPNDFDLIRILILQKFWIRFGIGLTDLRIFGGEGGWGGG